MSKNAQIQNKDIDKDVYFVLCMKFQDRNLTCFIVMSRYMAIRRGILVLKIKKKKGASFFFVLVSFLKMVAYKKAFNVPCNLHDPYKSVMQIKYQEYDGKRCQLQLSLILLGGVKLKKCFGVKFTFQFLEPKLFQNVRLFY